MAANDLAFAQGMRDTRGTLRRWNAHPWPVLRAWTWLAAAVAAGLLAAVLVVASVVPADPTPLWIPGISGAAEMDEVASIVFRNSLVLALHAFACVAGFIAGSSLPLTAAQRQGISRWIHEKARPIALGWVVAVTCFSLITQAYILGSDGATLAAQFDLSPAVLVLSVLPHALPELIALFLPLAAWMIASRRDEWSELLAATFATSAIAIPILVATASWEAHVWPQILQVLTPLA